MTTTGRPPGFRREAAAVSGRRRSVGRLEHRDGRPLRSPSPGSVVVLVSGSGTLLQALIDASADPATACGSRRSAPTVTGSRGWRAPNAPGSPPSSAACPTTSTERPGTRRSPRPSPHTNRRWSCPRASSSSSGRRSCARFAGRYVNSHNALLPSFPGIHGPRDALDYGVKVTGATLFVVDEGIDTGVIVGQVAVPVEDDDTVDRPDRADQGRRSGPSSSTSSAAWSARGSPSPIGRSPSRELCRHHRRAAPDPAGARLRVRQDRAPRAGGRP